MNKYLNVIYQICRHISFILIGIGGVYLATFQSDVAPAWFRILAIIGGFILIIITTLSMYTGLTRNGDDYY